MTWTYHVSWRHSFNSLRVHLSRDLLLSNILIFVKIKTRNNTMCLTTSWNASAEVLTDGSTPTSCGSSHLHKTFKNQSYILFIHLPLFLQMVPPQHPIAKVIFIKALKNSHTCYSLHPIHSLSPILTDRFHPNTLGLKSST